MAPAAARLVRGRDDAATDEGNGWRGGGFAKAKLEPECHPGAVARREGQGRLAGFGGWVWGGAGMREEVQRDEGGDC